MKQQKKYIHIGYAEKITW